jgi:hypothetical protein
MYGVGFLIFYYPILSFVNEFWIERRGKWHMESCAHLQEYQEFVMPFALEAMFNKYGYPTTLRAIAIGLAALTGLLITALERLIAAFGTKQCRMHRLDLFEEAAVLGLLHFEYDSGARLLLPITLPPLIRNFHWT